MKISNQFILLLVVFTAFINKAFTQGSWYENDFSDPSGWVMQLEQGGVMWEIGDNQDLVNGYLSDYLGLMDSDNFGFINMINNQTEPTVSRLLSPSIDLGGAPDFVLEFDQRIRKTGDQATKVVVFINDYPYYEVEINTNISSLLTSNRITVPLESLPNESDIRVGFQWESLQTAEDDGEVLGWIVDNLVIREGYSRDLNLYNEAIGHSFRQVAHWSIPEPHVLNIPLFYREVPLSQNAPVSFKAEIYNQGLSSSTETVLEAIVRDEDGIEIFNSQSTIFELDKAEESDTVSTNEDHIPQQTGDYEIELSARDLSWPYEMPNANVFYDFHVTDYIFSYNTPGIYESFNGVDIHNQPEGTLLMLFDIFEDTDLTAIYVGIGNETTISATELLIDIRDQNSTNIYNGVLPVESSDAGEIIQLNLETPVTLDAGMRYVVNIREAQESPDFYYAHSGEVFNATAMYDGGSNIYGLEFAPIVKLSTDPCDLIAPEDTEIIGDVDGNITAGTVFNTTCEGACDVNVAIDEPISLFTYTWYDAEENQLSTGDNIENLCAGNYFVVASDDCERTDTAHFTIQDQFPGVIMFNSVNASSCGNSDGAIGLVLDASYSVGDLLIEWNGPVSGDETISTTDYIIENLPYGDYEVTVTDIDNGCNPFIENITVDFDMVDQSLCLVTVDSLNADHNIIVWEKPVELSNVDSFFVYREITTNNYEKIGAVHSDSLSQFADMGANPNSTSYRYKISTLDTCGNIADLGVYHNTIHLQYQGNGNFNWNHYTIEGEVDVVASYNFYRDNEGTGDWEIIQVVSGTQNTFSDVDYNSYPDANYRVDVNWVDGGVCTSTRAVDHNSSRSNVRGVSGGGGGEECDEPVNVTAIDVSDNLATIEWASSESEWNIAWGESPVDIGNPDNLVEGTGNNPYTLANLTPETSYDVYVQAVCDDSNVSEWSEMMTFTTNGVGVGEIYNNSGIKVFPNPASSQVDIRIEDATLPSGLTVRMYDISGKLVHTSMMTGTASTIQVNQYQNGIYFLEISKDENSSNAIGRYKLVIID